MLTATGQRTILTDNNRRKLLSQVTYRAGGVQFEGLSELPRGYQELDRPVFKRLIPPSVVAKTNQLAIQKMLKCLQQASTQVLVIESPLIVNNDCTYPKTNSARVLISSLVGVLYGSVFW